MFTLEAMNRISDRYDRFFNRIPMIHIAGTNGKGSTAYVLKNILMSKYRVGLYTSPYDQKRFDNISINDRSISEEEIDQLIKTYRKDFEDFKLSEFEVDTWLALTYFEKMDVDLAIIEVGLGGRDDATNVILPKLSVITNIGSDHQDVLGSTVQMIALAKAGIIKERIPVILGPTIKGEAFEVIKEQAKKHQATMIQTAPCTYQTTDNGMTLYMEDQTYHVPYKALYQAENIALALNVIKHMKHIGFDLSHHDIQDGLQRPLQNKRFQIISDHPLIIMDGAHNIEGVDALVHTLFQTYHDRTIRIVMSVLKDKPYVEMIRRLKSLTDDIIFVPFEHPRALPKAMMKDLDVKIIDNIKEITHLLDDPTIIYVFTGSLYFLQQVDPILKEYCHENQ